jgi:hypothetical protein
VLPKTIGGDELQIEEGDKMETERRGGKAQQKRNKSRVRTTENRKIKRREEAAFSPSLLQGRDGCICFVLS